MILPEKGRFMVERVWRPASKMSRASSVLVENGELTFLNHQLTSQFEFRPNQSRGRLMTMISPLGSKNSNNSRIAMIFLGS